MNLISSREDTRDDDGDSENNGGGESAVDDIVKAWGEFTKLKQSFFATFQDVCQKVAYEVTFLLSNVLLLVKKRLMNTNFLSNGFVA
jgi:hypothetical protein